jgi:hypothetical protein
VFLDVLVSPFRLRILRLPTKTVSTELAPDELLCFRYLDVDFARFFESFLFDECDHSFEFIGDLFIA